MNLDLYADDTTLFHPVYSVHTWYGILKQPSMNLNVYVDDSTLFESGYQLAHLWNTLFACSTPCIAQDEQFLLLPHCIEKMSQRFKVTFII